MLAQASGKEDGVRLSFFSMGSPAKNSQQTAARTAMLGECVDLVALLTRHNSIVLPGSKNDVHMDFSQPIFSIRNQRGHVYHVPSLKKIGSCGNGSVRFNEYDRKEDDNFTQTESIEIRSIFDLDNLSDDVQKELIPRMLQAMSKFMPTTFPMTEELAYGRDRLLKEVHALTHIRNSWPPGKTKACPPECISAQVLMASLISPRVSDAFDAPPKADVETLDDCYDTSNYSPEQVWYYIYPATGYCNCCLHFFCCSVVQRSGSFAARFWTSNKMAVCDASIPTALP
jgi:hypothetical protein